MAIRLVKVEDVTEEERARCRDGGTCLWCGGGKWRKLLCDWCAAGRAPIHVACWLEALDPAFYLGLISGKGIMIYVPDTEDETAGPALPSEDGLPRPPPPVQMAQAEEPPPMETPHSAAAEAVAPPEAAPMRPPPIPPPPPQRNWWHTIWAEHDADA